MDTVTKQLKLGRHWYFNLFNDAKRLAFVLSRYKQSAQLIPNGARVLELGCSEGIGATLLGERCSHYHGVDLDGDAIDAAQINLLKPKYTFEKADFMGKEFGKFDAIVSLDVVEHIYQEFENKYFQTIVDNMLDDGIAIVGTPNITSAPFASKASQEGHVNLYDGRRLTNVMEKYFKSVFLFGINDEILHLGYHPMAHYLFVLGCGRK